MAMTSLSLSDYRPVGLLLPGMAPLHEDEMAWSLYERDVFTFNGKAQVREQTIRLQRNGRLVEFTCILGPASNWDCGPFAVASLFEDSVGQVREAADFMRGEIQVGLAAAMNEHLEEFNVIEAAIEQAEQMQRWQRQNPHTTANRRLQTNKERKGPLLFPMSGAAYTS